MNQEAKKCSVCGTEYGPQEFGQLPYVGVQLSEDDGKWYETTMRNCACGSTLATETVYDSYNDMEQARGGK